MECEPNEAEAKVFSEAVAIPRDKPIPMAMMKAIFASVQRMKGRAKGHLEIIELPTPTPAVATDPEIRPHYFRAVAEDEIASDPQLRRMAWHTVFSRSGIPCYGHIFATAYWAQKEQSACQM